MSEVAPILELQEVARSFGGIRALKGVSFRLEPARVTTLIGPNGAGKTTIFDIITGFVPPDAGQVLLWGGAITGMPPHRIARKGLVRLFQHIRVFPNLSVLDNVLVAFPNYARENPLVAWLPTPATRKGEEANLARARELLHFVGLQRLSGAPGGHLSYGQQKLLGICRQLAAGAELMLLDEPTSGLDPVILDRIQSLIRELTREMGKTVLLIEHSLDVVRAVSDHVLFLDQGEVIAAGHPEEILANRELGRLYLGA